MSDTTITNIPSALETRVKESSDGTQVPPAGPGSSDRFTYITSLFAKSLKVLFWIVKGYKILFYYF